MASEIVNATIANITEVIVPVIISNMTIIADNFTSSDPLEIT